MDPKLESYFISVGSGVLLGGLTEVYNLLSKSPTDIPTNWASVAMAFVIGALGAFVTLNHPSPAQQAIIQQQQYVITQQQQTIAKQQAVSNTVPLVPPKPPQ